MKNGAARKGYKIYLWGFNRGIPHKILLSVIVNFSGPYSKTLVGVRAKKWGFAYDFIPIDK